MQYDTQSEKQSFFVLQRFIYFCWARSISIVSSHISSYHNFRLFPLAMGHSLLSSNWSRISLGQVQWHSDCFYLFHLLPAWHFIVAIFWHHRICAYAHLYRRSMKSIYSICFIQSHENCALVDRKERNRNGSENAIAFFSMNGNNHYCKPTKALLSGTWMCVTWTASN